MTTSRPYLKPVIPDKARRAGRDPESKNILSFPHFFSGAVTLMTHVASALESQLKAFMV
jgi:hypothetical protein